MAKNVTPSRVPSQNVVSATTPLIDLKDPNRMFLKQGAARVADLGQINSYAKYITAPATDYVIKKEDVEDEERSVFNLSLATGEVNLSAIEDVQSSIYYDTLGNPKVKYVLKIRNLSLDKDNVVGVDARIYNPFA
jgi:hypothetical protein